MKYLKCLLTTLAVVVLARGAGTNALAGGVLGEPLSVDDCWRVLPATASGGGQRLPNWALFTARVLPRTTAAMLDLDRLHRTQNELGPVLRGKMRWVAADANRCDYSRATAEADLRRAGVSDREITSMKSGRNQWSAGERPVLDFARRMTQDAGSVTDDEVAYLRESFGEQKLAAMVLLLAYANFQDRLLLSLGVPLEDGGPIPAVEVRFSKKSAAPPVPARARPEDRHGPDVPRIVDDPEWVSLGFDVLQTNLNLQRASGGRIRVPSYAEYLRKLPADATRPKVEIRIKWSLVCMVYQPILASAWSASTTAFREEAKQDRVFEESLFWVVTRTIHCFY